MDPVIFVLTQGPSNGRSSRIRAYFDKIFYHVSRYRIKFKKREFDKNRLKFSRERITVPKLYSSAQSFLMFRSIFSKNGSILLKT